MRAIIDADGIIFRSGFAVEHRKYKLFLRGEEHNGAFSVYDYKKEIPKELLSDPEVECRVEVDVEPLQNSLFLVKQTLENILEATKATSHSVYIKGKGNFREEVAKTRGYKANRDVTHRPRYEKQIREYMKTYWEAEEVDGIEVDDQVAIEFLRDPARSILCTMDKDLDQIPGLHYNYAKGELYTVAEDEACRNFYIQLLAGDSSDNIQGVEGIGKAIAAKLLADCHTPQSMFSVVSKEYNRVYGDRGQEMLIEMATLLHILRKEGDRWSPPKGNE